jgi:hypothetical protein
MTFDLSTIFISVYTQGLVMVLTGRSDPGFCLMVSSSAFAQVVQDLTSHVFTEPIRTR